MNKTTFVAEIEGKVVGYIMLTKENGVWYVNAIYIDPGFQGKGAGGALMRTGLNWLEDCPVQKVEVAAYNQNAIGFYQYFGFEPGDRNLEPFMVGEIPMPLLELERRQ